MSHVYYQNIPLIPQKSHFHGNTCTGKHSRQQQPVQITTSPLPEFAAFTYTFLFHILSFLVKLEAKLWYAAAAASLFHNDRRPPLQCTHKFSLCPWKPTLGSCFATQITGNHPQTHTLLREIRASLPAIYFKNAKQGYVCNLCLLTLRRRYSPLPLSFFALFRCEK